jgi:hypothetical protein
MNNEGYDNIITLSPVAFLLINYQLIINRLSFIQHLHTCGHEIITSRLSGSTSTSPSDCEFLISLPQYLQGMAIVELQKNLTFDNGLLL